MSGGSPVVNAQSTTGGPPDCSLRKKTMIEELLTRPSSASGQQARRTPSPATGLDEAITRSQSYLLSEQKPEGYWVGELMVDVTLVADMVAFYHWWGKVDEEWQRKAVHHIFSRQLPEGGWNIYPHGPAEVNATIKAYLALKLAGIPSENSPMPKARAA